MEPAAVCADTGNMPVRRISGMHQPDASNRNARFSGGGGCRHGITEYTRCYDGRIRFKSNLTPDAAEIKPIRK